MSVSAVIPAYNEEQRIGTVIQCLLDCAAVDQVVVISDGSTDGTAEVAGGYPGVKVIRLPSNRGKGGAMLAGAEAADGDVLVFLDADLIGLTPSHVESLVRPVAGGDADMSIAQFKGGRRCTDWAQVIAPYISGQRAMFRDSFLAVPGLDNSRYGVEVAIGHFARLHGLNTVMVQFRGVTHPMKEEKLGLLKGGMSRLRMYWEIMKLIVLDSRRTRQLKRRLGIAVDDVTYRR